MPAVVERKVGASISQERVSQSPLTALLEVHCRIAARNAIGEKWAKVLLGRAFIQEPIMDERDRRARARPTSSPSQSETVSRPIHKRARTRAGTRSTSLAGLPARSDRRQAERQSAARAVANGFSPRRGPNAVGRSRLLLAATVSSRLSPTAVPRRDHLVDQRLLSVRPAERAVS
jgi:hypothetical protein